MENGVLRLPDGVSRDLDEARREVARTGFAPVLDGFDEPLAQEIRSLVRGLDARARRPSRGDDAYAVLGRLLLRTEPDFVATSLLRHWFTVKYRAHPERILEMFGDLLASLPSDDPRRASLLTIYGWNAYLLTRYGLARRSIEEAYRLAERSGDVAIAAQSSRTMVGIEVAEGRWEAARVHADLAIELGLTSGDPGQHSAALFNSAWLRCQVLDLDRALAEFRESLRLAEGLSRAPDSIRTYRANLVRLAFGYGLEVGELPPAPETPAAEGGYSAFLEASIRFWLAFGEDPRAAAPTAARQLEVCGEDGMEWSFVVALDATACLFGRLRHAPEAAACIRMGSRSRHLLGTRRSPGERFLLRRHAPGPYLGRQAAPRRRMVLRQSSGDGETRL